MSHRTTSLCSNMCSGQKGSWLVCGLNLKHRDPLIAYFKYYRTRALSQNVTIAPEGALTPT